MAHDILSNAPRPADHPNPCIVLTFRPDIRFPYAPEVEREHAKANPEPWQALQSKFPGASLQPYFDMFDEATLERLRGPTGSIAWARRPRLTDYYTIVTRDGHDPEAVLEIECRGYNRIATICASRLATCVAERLKTFSFPTMM